jgi:hypothetical protein
LKKREIQPSEPCRQPESGDIRHGLTAIHCNFGLDSPQGLSMIL